MWHLTLVDSENVKIMVIQFYSPYLAKDSLCSFRCRY